MKWFFALNEQSPRFGDYCRLIKVAVYTAYLHTSLQPYFIYDGEENEFTAWLRRRNVQVIHHRTGFYRELRDLAESTQREWILNMGAGAFLRIDLPKILAESGVNDEYVLYTDTDIMFLDEIAFHLDTTCPYFAVAPEIDIKDNVNINTGVMLMNIPGLLKDYVTFCDFTRQFLFEFASLDWDQTAYRTYYHMEWNPMNPLYNWKPYWGSEENAKIMHFHGLKPTVVEDARNDRLIGKAKDIAAMSGNEYYRQVDIWQKYLFESEEDFRFERDEAVGDRKASLSPPPDVDPADGLKNRVVHESQYAELCGDGADCDWRAVKGKLVLWILTEKNDHQEDIKAYLALSRFFSLLGIFHNALFHARVAYSLAPDNPLTVIWLAELYFREGNASKAIQTLEDALKENPDNVEMMKSLARMYLVLHQYQTSCEYFEQAGAIAPDDPDIKKGLLTIAQIQASAHMPR